MDYFNSAIMHFFQNIYYLVAALTIIVHLVCSLAVISDMNNFAKHNIPPQMMPNFAWVITVLMIGIWGLFIYWVMHHSSLSRYK